MLYRFKAVRNHCICHTTTYIQSPLLTTFVDWNCSLPSSVWKWLWPGTKKSWSSSSSSSVEHCMLRSYKFYFQTSHWVRYMSAAHRCSWSAYLYNIVCIVYIDVTDDIPLHAPGVGRGTLLGVTWCDLGLYRLISVLPSSTSPTDDVMWWQPLYLSWWQAGTSIINNWRGRSNNDSNLIAGSESVSSVGVKWITDGRDRSVWHHPTSMATACNRLDKGSYAT